jgi:predicted transcriptional regulator
VKFSALQVLFLFFCKKKICESHLSRSSGFDKEEIEMAHIDTKVLTAHVPLPLVEKVDQIAARLERSRGWIMKQALSAWIAQEEERSRLTRDALADVDSGSVINHQSVQTWADSLSTDTPLPVPQ